MWKKTTSVILLVGSGLFSQVATAWTDNDTWWQSAYLAAHVADWGQTLDIASQCQTGNYYETNPVLGRCPSAQWVNTYFLGTALIHTGIAQMLSGRYRRWFQVGTLGMELNYVNSNAQIGLRVSF